METTPRDVKNSLYTDCNKDHLAKPLLFFVIRIPIRLSIRHPGR